MSAVRRSTRLNLTAEQTAPPSPRSLTLRPRCRDIIVISDNEYENEELPNNNHDLDGQLQNQCTDNGNENNGQHFVSPPMINTSTNSGDVKNLRSSSSSKNRELLSKRKIMAPKQDVVTTATDVPGPNGLDGKQMSPTKVSRMNDIERIPPEATSPSRLIAHLSLEQNYTAATVNDAVSSMTCSSAAMKPPPARNKYQSARRVLNSAETNLLPGREKELQELHEILSNHLNNRKSGSLYVSGQPGTGKTACLSKLLKSPEFADKFIKVYINCTSISSIGGIYKRICTELKVKTHGHTEKDYLAGIRQLLTATTTKTSKQRMILMVLDEIDQLCGQKQSVLYTIFEWPALPASRLLLIGIANSLDLTDRLLMRLNAKCDLRPRLMHFTPYTKQQIVDIFTSRLEEAGVRDVFPAATIQLLAAKVSAISGDVRRALDIGRRVVEIAEEQRCNSAHTVAAKNLEDLDLDEVTERVEPVKVTQVVNVLNKVYGASQHLHEDMEAAFPVQQKIMLCCLMMMLNKEKNKDITIGRLHDVYRRVCTKRNIQPVDQAEFASLVELVETRGILRVIRKKEPRLNKVQLQWDEEEVNAALCDKQLIASILDDSSCLKR